MARIDEITSGVLQQGLNAGRFVGFGMIRLGRAGVGDNPTLAENIQHFRSGTGLGATSPQRAVPNMFTAGETAGVQFIASAGGAVLETRFVTVVRTFYDAANRWNIIVDLNPGNSDADIPAGTHNSRYQFITGMNLGAGEVTSTRNFNFDAGLTITNFRNVPFLGTDENGVVIAGMGGAFIYEQNVFPGDTDSSLSGTDADGREPTQGDFWINPSTLSVSAPGTAVYAPVIRVAPAVPAGSPANFVGYGGGPNVAIDASGIGIYNIEISHNRNSQVSPALGVASNPLVLAWRSGDAGAWTELSATVDSSPNGHQGRVRVANTIPFADYLAIPDGAQIGYRVSTRPGAVTEFEAGTYIYNGSEWRLLNRDTTSSSASDQFIDGFDLQRSATVLGQRDAVFSYNTGSGALVTPFPDIVPRYLDVIGNAATNTAAPPTTIGSVGQVLAVEAFGAAGATRLNWTNPAASISIEGHDGTNENNVVNDVTYIDFSHSDFFVDPGVSGRVLVRSRSGGGGGTSVLVQDHGRNEVDTLNTLNIGGGLIVTPDDVADPASAVEAVVEALRVNLVTAGGTPIINHLNVFSVAAPSGTPYIFPAASGMFSGETVQFINDGDFLILKNVTSSTLTIEHSGVLGTHRIDGLLQDLEIQQNETVTLVYSTTGSTTTDANDTWLITHRTSDISDLSITNTAGSMTAANLENITIGDGLVLNAVDANNATISAAPGLTTVEIAMAAVTDFTLNAVNIITAEANNLRIPATADDGDILIVKNRSGSTRSFGTTAEVDGLARGRIRDFVALEDGNSITLVYSTDLATDGWVISSAYTLPESSATTWYTHEQTTASATWSVTHNLDNRYPVITVYDDNHQVVIPMEITATGDNTTQINFPIAVSGRATFVG